MQLNNFNLTEETAFLFVLSHEYKISFAVLLSLYDLSEDLFWGYLSAFSPALKMGVRKGSQLSKTARRIYKTMFGLKEKHVVKREKVMETEDGVVLDKNGNPRKEKVTVETYEEIVLTPEEQSIKDVLTYYTTRGYSNGEKFYSDEQILDMRTSKALKNDIVTIDGDNYLRCSQLDHFIEKYMPDMEVADFKRLSVRDFEEKIRAVNKAERKALVEAK